jgi:hypothetical protein
VADGTSAWKAIESRGTKASAGALGKGRVYLREGPDVSACEYDAAGSGIANEVNSEGEWKLVALCPSQNSFGCGKTVVLSRAAKFM